MARSSATAATRFVTPRSAFPPLSVPGEQPAWVRRWAAEALVGLLALVVFGWRWGQASTWWDEAVTRDVVSRPVPAILDLAGHVDLVHLAYYLVASALTGDDPTVADVRRLSVAAGALTVVVLVRLGRRLGELRVGVVAGLLMVAAPLSTRYAQEARPYALVMLLAACATLALVNACRRPWLRRRWAGYGVLLAALGLANVLALTLLVAHLGVALADSPATRRAWARTTAVVLVALAPFVLVASGQRGQVAWLPRPTVADLTAHLSAQWGSGWLLAVLLVTAVALAVAPEHPLSARLPGGPHRDALLLGLAWGLLPPATLWLASQVHPLFDGRYVAFAMPGVALAVASLATALRPVGAVVPLVLLSLAGLGLQSAYRHPATGHEENLGGIATVIERSAQPGDAVVFLPASRRVVALGFPHAFRTVDDVALAEDPSSSGTLFGVEDLDRLVDALPRYRRVWLVTGETRYGESTTQEMRAKGSLLMSGWRMASVVTRHRYAVVLFEAPQVAPVPR